MKHRSAFGPARAKDLLEIEEILFDLFRRRDQALAWERLFVGEDDTSALAG